MSSTSSPLVPLLLAALTAVGVAIGIQQLGSESKTSSTASPAAPVKAKWTATAQGRVEPKTGEIKLSSLSPGRIEEVLVGVNDQVKAGDLLVMIEETDALARVQAADAEAGVRRRERDTETNVPRLAQDRRNAEDKLNATERQIATARVALDRMLIARSVSPASVTADQLAAARAELLEAGKRLVSDREAYRQSQIASGVPLPTRLEAGLTASRSDLTLAEAALERTRVRAPFDGTILQVLSRVGEMAVSSPEQPLIVIGDLTQLKVRAEVEERYASKIQVGQSVVLKSDAFTDREFAGKVGTIAQAMRPPRLAQRGPRRPADLDTLEVMIDVEPGTVLLPGMRVDVFFKVEAASTQAPSGQPPRPAASIVTPPAQAGSAAAVVQGATAIPASASGAQVLPPLAPAQPK